MTNPFWQFVKALSNQEPISDYIRLPLGLSPHPFNATHGIWGNGPHGAAAAGIPPMKPKKPFLTDHATLLEARVNV